MADPEFKHVAIIGIGLLGSSIAHAVNAYGGADKVSMWDISEDVRARAARVVPGAVCETAQEAVTGADCVILCTPVGVLQEVTGPDCRDREVRTRSRLCQPVSGHMAYPNT